MAFREVGIAQVCLPQARPDKKYAIRLQISQAEASQAGALNPANLGFAPRPARRLSGDFRFGHLRVRIIANQPKRIGGPAQRASRPDSLCRVSVVRSAGDYSDGEQKKD